MKRFGTVGKIWKHENKDAYACNMTRFDTIFWLTDNNLKAMKLNGAFWRFYDRRLLRDPKVLPFNFYCKFGRFIFLTFFRWNVGPGLLCLKELRRWQRAYYLRFRVFNNTIYLYQETCLRLHTFVHVCLTKKHV